jgi:hypothetical protein
MATALHKYETDNGCVILQPQQWQPPAPGMYRYWRMPTPELVGLTYAIERLTGTSAPTAREEVPRPPAAARSSRARRGCGRQPVQMAAAAAGRSMAGCP